MRQWKSGTFLVLAVALVLVFATQAWAKERTTWRWDGGHFENTKGNTWVEKVADETRKWTEIRRTDDFVELSRDGADGKEHFMRLFDDHAAHKVGKGGEWERVHTGKWDK
jgi:hypothetical protein